jgi:HK97 family phage major capsid protein
MSDDTRQVTPSELAQVVAEVKAATSRVENSMRSASKAGMIGMGPSYAPSYEPGSFLTTIYEATGNDVERQMDAKARLAGEFRSFWSEPTGKATLGLTDATGGWVMPNALVEQLVKPAPTARGLIDLVTIRSGVNTAAVDIPWRSTTPTAAVAVAWGQTKTNLDLAYGGYTATMYTLAQIYDVSKQFLRKSAGAAEQDVLSELREGFRRGLSYYLWNGSGTSQPLGLVTAFTGAPATFTTSFSAAATLAGSVITAIGKALGDLAARGHTTGLQAIMSPTSYANLVTQGADTAGVYFSGTQGAQAIPGFAAGTPVVFGVPCVADPDCPTDDLYVGDFGKLVVYQGEAFTITSSDTAGDRFDKNLVGFRGEGDIGFDVRPYVYSGHIQAVADIVP